MFNDVFLFLKHIDFLFVGGAVRDYLLNINHNDIDIVFFSKKIINDFSNQIFDFNEKYLTFKIKLNDTLLNFSHIRKDMQSGVRHGNNRNAIVDFNASILDDAFRRDFKLNALYMNRDYKIINPLNVKDLHKVEFIKDPQTSVKEDYMRLWRYYRFFSNYSDEKPLNIQFDKTIKHSKVLVKSELLKILNSKRMQDVIPYMKDLLTFHFEKEPNCLNKTSNNSYKNLSLLYDNKELLKEKLMLSNKEINLL